MQVAHENLHIVNLIIPHCLSSWFHSISNLPRTKGRQKYSHMLYHLGSCHLGTQSSGPLNWCPRQDYASWLYPQPSAYILSKMLAVPGWWNLRAFHTSAWPRFTSPLASSHLSPSLRVEHNILFSFQLSVPSFLLDSVCVVTLLWGGKKSNHVIIEKLPSRICFISNEINCSDLCLWPWTDEFRPCWIPSWEQVQEFSLWRDKTCFDTWQFQNWARCGGITP